MITDIQLRLSNAQAVTTTAASTLVYDVTGAGAGVAPSMTFGTATVFGEDIGAGDSRVRPIAQFFVPTAFTANGAATMVVAVQAAIDDGSNNPSTYTTLAETGAIPVANLIAGANFQLPIPPLAPGEALPRFYRFNYTIATGPMTAGNITGYIGFGGPLSLTNIRYPKNYVSV